MKKLIRTALKVAIVTLPLLFLSSCVSMITDIAADALVDLSPGEVREYQKTLDPYAELSKRSAIILMTATNPEKLWKLQSKAPKGIENVAKPNYTNVATFTIPSFDGYEINCYVMYPKGYKENKLYPCIFFSHGGGFSTGDFNSYNYFCRKFANNTDSIVFFYEYRLAPQYKFPYGVDDTWSVYTYLIDPKNKEEMEAYQIDTSKIVLLGDSSGGNFSSGLVIRLKENNLPLPKGVMLLYPAVDVSENLNYSKLAFGGVGTDSAHKYFTSMKYLSSVMNDYLEDPKVDAYKPYASPLIMLMGLLEVEGWDNKYKDYKAKLELPLDYFPPHFIVLPEVDALRDDGKMYDAVLKILGAESTYKEYPGMMHVFTMFDGFVGGASNSMDDISNKIIEWVK